MTVATDILPRDPRHRQRAAWPRFIVDRDPRIGNIEAPALLVVREMRRQVIH